MSIPDIQARYLESGIRSGQVLVTVDTRDRVDEALRLLARHGAEADVGGRPAGEGDTVLI